MYLESTTWTRISWRRALASLQYNRRSPLGCWSILGQREARRLALMFELLRLSPRSCCRISAVYEYCREAGPRWGEAAADVPRERQIAAAEHAHARVSFSFLLQEFGRAWDEPGLRRRGEGRLT